ncbi:hypothetical protein FGL98_09905 [Leekyejoonella antrihumi]|uniref:DMT family transporter n=1 Tax=Leekyejoonella antrihumi TaxID=1660198 RepID=A0A563E2P5_9MICO|nr:hypothetical protein FGL98_09905 [Leekyejoonella antrihumi]
MLGLLGALVAALAYGSATIMEAIGVRRLADVPRDRPWQDRLRAGQLFGLGILLDALGFLASAAALHDLPLFLVESAVASAVAVTAVLAVFVLGARLRRAEIAALLVVGVGLVLLALTAQGGPARHTGSLASWMVLATVVPVGALAGGALLDRHRGRSSVLLALASGAGFAMVGVAARMFEFRHPWWHSLADPLVWTMVLQGVLSISAYGFALERGRTTTVAAITFGVETVLPALIGLSLLGDAVRPGLSVVAGLGFVATLAGCIALASHTSPDAATEP